MKDISKDVSTCFPNHNNVPQNFWDLNLSNRYKKGPTPEGKKMRLLVTNFHLVELTAAFGNAVEIAPELSSGDRKSIVIANHFLKQEISKTTKKK